MSSTASRHRAALACCAIDRSEEVYRHIQQDADARLDANLADNLNKDENPTEMPEVPADTPHLKARAASPVTAPRWNNTRPSSCRSKRFK